MAGNRIEGITIELGGDATKLEKALSDVNKSLKNTQAALKDVDKLLKLDPGNVTLLKQKQELLNRAIKDTQKKLDTEKEALKQLKEADQTPEVREQMQRLERQIADDEQALESLQDESKSFGSVAAQQFKAVGQAVQDAGEKITGMGEKLAPVSAAAAAAGGALVKLGYDAVQNADDLNTLSKQTGLTTAEIQKMQYASDLIDVSFEDISGALRKMKGNMDGHADTWEKLGVATKNADGSMRDATDVFYDAVAALSQVENGTERDKLAMELFGKGADSLAGIIDDGGAALKQFGQEAEDAGLILSQDTLDALNETNDTIDKLKAEMGATLAQIGADIAQILAPALEKAAEIVSQVAEALRNLTPEQEKTILTILGIVAAVAPVLIIVGNVITMIGTLISSIGAIMGVLAPLGAVLTGPIVLAIAAVIAAGILLYKNWDKIKDAFKQMGDGLKRDWEALKTAIVTTVENIKTAVTTKFDDLKGRITSAADSIKTSVQQKFEAVKQAIITPIESARDKIKTAVDKIKNIVNNVKLQLPHFKLPHFKISGGVAPWGLGGQGTKPSISVEWYKKAYNNPVIFQNPTVLPTVGGLKGFGDGAGAEIVMGLNKLRELVGSTGNTVYMTVNAAPGMDVRQLADEVEQRLVQAQRAKNAVYA